MCDTMGKIIRGDPAIFAKNSDRSPNEPQVLEYIPHKIHTEKALRCTYITISQVPETNAMVISRPVWLWGAEMGVNEHGVCIGNEAVFTKGKYGKDALIGMDYVRLALERGNTALQAVHVITELLEKHGQGGSCGYDKDFHYDNSYLIMDRKEIYVLETADRTWAYKKYNHASISNRLCLGSACDAYSGESCDFTRKHSDWIYSSFSAAAKRRETTGAQKLDQVTDAFAALRMHSSDNAMCRGSVSSVCMHAGNLIADQTTSSMVVELGEEIRIYATGTSRPCLSLFKPHAFAAEGIIWNENMNNPDAYWRRMEERQRRLLGKIIPEEFHAERNELEKQLISHPDMNFFDEEEAFWAKWNNYPFATGRTSAYFRRYWDRKNKVFREES